MSQSVTSEPAWEQFKTDTTDGFVPAAFLENHRAFLENPYRFLVSMCFSLGIMPEQYIRHGSAKSKFQPVGEIEVCAKISPDQMVGAKRYIHSWIFSTISIVVYLIHYCKSILSLSLNSSYKAALFPF